MECYAMHLQLSLEEEQDFVDFYRTQLPLGSVPSLFFLLFVPFFHFNHVHAHLQAQSEAEGSQLVQGKRWSEKREQIGLRVTESESDRHPRVLSIWVGEIFVSDFNKLPYSLYSQGDNS